MVKGENKADNIFAKKNRIIVSKTFMLFSVVLFLAISLIATLAFTISARQINYSYIEQQLTITSETLRLRLAGMVNSELTLILKMADTPVIRQYFIDPANPELAALAHEEFEIFQEHFGESQLFWVNDTDKIFYSPGNEPFVLDPENPDNYWYNLTMYRTETHNLNINYNPDIQQTNLWVNVPVFLDLEAGGRRPVGMLGTGINLTEFPNFIVSGESEFDTNISPYMFNRFNEITSAIDYDLVDDKVRLDLHLEAGAEIIRIAGLLEDDESRIFSYGRYMYLVSSIPAMEWYLTASYPLPGFLALNQAINIVFFGMLFLILLLFIVINIFIILRDRKEKVLNDELAQERDVIQTMKDNIQQGVFLMNKDFKILPQFSKPLISILSYYDSELEGKNFLDILSASLDAKQLNIMKGYFSMVFAKSKSVKVLAAANPISEFQYKIEDRVKYLSTKFSLIEEGDSEPVIIGIIQDITREKEFEQEIIAQKEAQEREMKNIFDVIQVDPLVFQDFIDDVESNFNYINSILQDRSLSEAQAVRKIFQNVHAIKSNALILGLETLGENLHVLEDEIKAVSELKDINAEDVLGLTFTLERIMQEKDSYKKIIKKIEAFKVSNQVDTILIHSLNQAVEKTAEETQKKVELKVGQLDIEILETKLRKPIKDILFQCVRNSIYHGIEPVEERIQKNKRPKSILVFSIKKINDRAEIVFSDDGRGFDWEKIKNRFTTLHPQSKDVDKKTLLSAVFSPQFSTSEETTSVAGRGVGLNLVRDLVMENKGTIKVDSSDSGLTLKFIFPLAS